MLVCVLGDDVARDHESWVRLLLEHAESGALLRVAPAGADGAEPDPAQAGAWPAECVLPANALREALITVSRDRDRYDLRGLRVLGVDIPDRLDLDQLHLPCPLRLECSRFQAGASL